MKKRALCALLAMLLLLLSACQPAAQTNDPTNPAATATAPSTAGTPSATLATPPEANEGPEYLNLSSELPIVNEGYDITLKAAVNRRPNSGDSDKIWFWKYAKEFMKLGFEIEQVLDIEQYKNLSFAAGTMPDVYIDMAFTTNELMTYGVSEKQLLNLDEYINTTYMPNLSAIYEENPTYKAWITAPDGGIYSLGNFGNPVSPGAVRRMFINQTWLKQSSMTTPTTLEDFTAMLYAFKGLGDDIVPMGGGYNAANPSIVILNAYGYILTTVSELSVGIRDGKVVLPFGDREVFGEYLKTMNDYYVNGLISQDYYTIDNTAARALIAENKVGVIGEPAYLSVPTTFNEWWAIEPLTSDYHTQQEWAAPANAVKIGGFVVSSNCQYPDVAVRFADWSFNEQNYVLSIFGPTVEDTDLLMGEYGGWYLNDVRAIAFVDLDNDTKNLYNNSVYDYRMLTMSGWHDGVLGNSMDQYTVQQTMAGLEPIEQVYDLNDGDQHYRAAVDDALMPFTKGVEIYPTILFFSPEDNEAMGDLRTVLESYAATEIAKFITGARPLSEIDAYFDELDEIGFQEYLQYYVNAYTPG